MKKKLTPSAKTGSTDAEPVPDKGKGVPPESGFPIVGIGASAGGLKAFETFFSGMPADIDPGMAFVLVQHLAPDHKSILTDLIQRYTRMQVFEVEDGMIVAPNCAYIIPPGRDMAFLNGTLQLMEPSAPRGQRLPIDFFFQSLAQDQREKAICIVLSGTGSDGTQGLRAIKGEGGMAMVQSPDSAEYDGMPRSAIATALVDYVLPPSEMPARIIAYVAHAFRKPARRTATPELKPENLLKKIFILLRAQTSHDFSRYKPSTINRRIDRRLAINQIETSEEYVKYLRQTPKEVEALFRDLLIGVTNFFRDPSAFKAIEEQVIPKIFAGKPPGSMVRVWSTGCSTGEEAYSIAILMQEHLEVLKKGFKVQIFATDIDNHAIATARAGRYPASIAADISPERLARFFSADADGSAYRIHKGIRDMLIFSEQNVIKDPPFSRIDLICCRNLMIYMGADLQKKLIPLFHYALNPGGFLFLGTSETIGEFDTLFATIDRMSKLYQRKEDFDGAPRTALGRLQPSMGAREESDATLPDKAADSKKTPAPELGVQSPLPTGATVEAGSPEILKPAREELKRDLTGAMNKATGKIELANCLGMRVKTNGELTPVNMTIHPVTTGPGATPEAPLYLFVMNQDPASDAMREGEAALHTIKEAEESDVDIRIATLRQELRVKEEILQTSTEEYKSSSEEMQSINEEFQSTNEELETSKEELQSVNEELATVNSELQTKVTDLSRANNDMNNLLAGTGIGTVFVDHELRILRFTPVATKIINLIPSDIGRPVNHIVSNLLDYNRLAADLHSVLDALVPKEIEVQTQTGAWYEMRILPYRTVDNVIEGAVISFSDITAQKKMQDELRKANELLRLAIVVRDSKDAIVVHDFEGRILAWNPAAVKTYGWSESEALAMKISDMIPEGLVEKTTVEIRQLSQIDILKPYPSKRIAKDGRIVEVMLTASLLVNDSGKAYAVSTTERAIGGKNDE
ncbi:MAG: PAS domain-containing protein [Desulfobacteraceae bacterium]|jgi:two-component system CheB/CheR fusion protein|nr:PAS domain-containing protein [Desulfobacteraceae bacterium]